MSRIYLGGAGGAPTNNVIRSLRESGKDHLIGASSDASDLFLADVDERHVVPLANAPEYGARLLGLLNRTRPELAHFQNDFEIRAVSRMRKDVLATGVKLFMPREHVIETCVDKDQSYQVWQRAGIKVPRTMLIRDEKDLRTAFDTLGAKIWLRATEGGGGRGALPADDFTFAKLWIDRFKGWGHFTAAELLTSNTVTWLSIWYEGELVVAQTRRRKSWSFGNRTLSGVTGVTGVGETWSDDTVTRVSRDAISSIDDRPHGIYGVDMTYDQAGVPNPTEINISRFFTTVYFFTRAGLNMPRIFVDLALHGRAPSLAKKINPLPDGLLWIRGMDVEPTLIKTEEFEAFLKTQQVEST
ncbi:MAG: hypothetical protein U0228_05695 [Myxococcaceae bacterium]